jgi:hypothetical protein
VQFLAEHEEITKMPKLDHTKRLQTGL